MDLKIVENSVKQRLDEGANRKVASNTLPC